VKRQLEGYVNDYLATVKNEIKEMKKGEEYRKKRLAEHTAAIEKVEKILSDLNTIFPEGIPILLLLFVDNQSLH
jgi:hypothetical protein